MDSPDEIDLVIHDDDDGEVAHVVLVISVGGDSLAAVHTICPAPPQLDTATVVELARWSVYLGDVLGGLVAAELIRLKTDGDRSPEVRP